MMRVLAVAAALLLAGCATTGMDGYAFTNKEVDREAVLVRKREYADFDDLKSAAPRNVRNAWQQAGVHEGAWSELYPDGGCLIHIIDPQVAWRPEWLGHEVAHCLWGRWHR